MRTSYIWIVAAAATAFAAAAPAHAEAPMQGTLKAHHRCPALQSIRKGTNPGNVKLRWLRSYEVIAANKPDATYYRVIVPGAEPAERWVAARCGSIDATAPPPANTGGAVAGAAAAGGAIAARGAAGARATHVLALGWEPAFCEHHTDKIECREMKADSVDATHLSLHGLWPQPRGTQYCGAPAAAVAADRAHDWASLPEPEMSADTLKKLSAVMPGVGSKLPRHEWIVHGTCFGTSADAYFNRAAGLADAVANSPVSKLFDENVGRPITADQIRAAFDQSFGAGAGSRVAVSCHGRGPDRTITELVLNLAGDVKGSAPLGDLMRAADTVPQAAPAASSRQRRDCRNAPRDASIAMPHLIVEYSANLEHDLDPHALAAAIHQAALETGVFPIGGLRTRLARRDVYVIGDGHPDNRFIHVQARIGTGRAADVRAQAAEHIFAALKAATAAIFATRPLGLTLEIVEIDPVGSLKHNNLHTIIAARGTHDALGMLALKLCVPPVLVALMSLAARRWGPTVGGLILGLPWMTGPILYLLALEKGTPFLVSASIGAELAVLGIGAFILCLGYASGITGVAATLACAIAGYFAVAFVVQSLAPSLWLVVAASAAVLAAVYRLLPLPRSAGAPGLLPSWDIPARMAATFTLVSVIVASADLLGPQRSGLIASFPVILSVISSFTFRQWGRDALLRVLRGVALSLQAFVGFFAVVASASPVAGPTLAYVLAVFAR